MIPSSLALAREVQTIGKDANGKTAMIMQTVSLGCLFMMALPCAFQAINSVWKMAHDNDHHKR